MNKISTNADLERRKAATFSVPIFVLGLNRSYFSMFELFFFRVCCGFENRVGGC